MNTLGSLVLKYGETEFRCGTGYSDEQRQEIWNNKESYLGKLASIRYMSVGLKEKPRVPSFIGWRLFTPIIATHVSIRTSDTSSNLYKSPSQAYRTLSYHILKGYPQLRCIA